MRDDALDLIDRLLQSYLHHATPEERSARFLERTGFAKLISELLTLVPYIRLEGAR